MMKKSRSEKAGFPSCIWLTKFLKNLALRRCQIDAIPKGRQYDHTHPAIQGLVYVDKLFF